MGLYAEILTQSWTCFNAENYKALMIVDIEDFFSQKEITKLQSDLETRGLSLIIVADWYNNEAVQEQAYFNQITFEKWVPFMAGSNVPTLNALLHPYHVAFGEGVYQGSFTLSDH
jgi:membrane-bound transcription factor site-1 protease